jgi:hypothetical protein
MYFIMDVLHHGCTPSWMYSIMDVFHHGCIPSWMYSITDVFHHGCIPSWIYSIMNASVLWNCNELLRSGSFLEQFWFRFRFQFRIQGGSSSGPRLIYHSFSTRPKMCIKPCLFIAKSSIVSQIVGL